MNWLLRRTGPSSFSFSSTAEQVTEGIDVRGLTAIVTGASSGIGTETARVLALRGAHVVLAVRNVDAGNAVKESIIKEIGNTEVDVLELDLSLISSVQKFVSNFKSLNLPVNILVNNAGVMACPFQLSQDGVELQFATNHIGFLARFVKSLIKSIPQGASTSCYLALHPRLKGVSGKYFYDNNEAAPSKHATDQELAKKLWELSEKMVS